MGNLAGKIGKIPRHSNAEITQEEIDEAVKNRYESFRNLSAPNKDDIKPIKVEDDGHYLTIQMPPFKDSPIDQIRRGEPIRIKTVFHSVDVEIEDEFGGKFSSTYEIIDSVNKLTEFLNTSFPNYSKQDIERLAEESGKSYEETKNGLIQYTAEQIFEGRIAIAKFFHKEVKEILKIVIDDLITDAQFYAMSLFGYRLVDGTDFGKRLPKFYEKKRKERIKIISGKGRPQGKSLSREEHDNFIEQIKNAFQELETKRQKITKTAVARKIYTGHSNPVQQLNRFFKRYDFINFNEILQNYQKNRTKK